MAFREEIIGDCVGVPITIIGNVTSIIVYAIKPDRDAAPVYVGSTSQSLRSRVRGHLLDARRGSELPIHEWMRTHQGGFVVEVLQQFTEPETRRAEREQFWVSQFSGLLNLTDGGPGMSGHRFVGTEHAARISAGMKTGATFSCQHCGNDFWRKQREIILGNNKFCSRACYAGSLRGVSKPMPPGVAARGIAAAAAAKRKRSHCRNGHQFSPETTRFNQSGARVCRICERASKQRYLERADVSLA